MTATPAATGDDAERAELRDLEARLLGHHHLDVEPTTLEPTQGPVGHVHALVGGAGPTVVLLHGAGMFAGLWVPLLPHLVASHRVVAVDLPGCGLTDAFAYARDLDLRDHAASFIAGLLDALGETSAALVGNSLGAMYGLFTGVRAPDRVTALGVVGAPGSGLPGARGNPLMALSTLPALGPALLAHAPRLSPARTRHVLGRLGGASSVDGHPEELFAAAAIASHLAAPTMASLFPRLMRWRTARPDVPLRDEELRRLDVRTLFVWGEHDAFQAPEAGHRAAALMPRARVEVVPGGHHPWLDDPAGCGRLITGFLAAGDRV